MKTTNTMQSTVRAAIFSLEVGWFGIVGKRDGAGDLRALAEGEGVEEGMEEGEERSKERRHGRCEVLCRYEKSQVV